MIEKFLQELQADLSASMKGKDTEKSNFLRNLISETTVVLKSSTPTDIISLIKKMMKSRTESIAAYENAGRTDSADLEKKELELIKTYAEKYLPSQMSAEEILSALNTIFKNNNLDQADPKRVQGTMMGMFNKDFKGKADNSLVLQIIKDNF